MRAIVSVSNKVGITGFVGALVARGIEVYATGGTKDVLVGAGLPVRSVSELTGFPEILGGRVKTLHPAVHGGILARRASVDHMADLARHGLSTIDMVVVNLYPFVDTIRRPGATLGDALENIDIGGPTMIRAAAKNYPDVIVLVDPADYPAVLEEMKRQGGVSEGLRRRLAAKAFLHVALYDTYIANYLRSAEDTFPQSLTVALEKIRDFRYGENPHQQAAFYADASCSGATIAGARYLHGKPLSFCDTLDLDVALSCAREFAAPTVAIVKRSNPCGLACDESLAEAYRRAHAGDPFSAVGGAVGLNRPVDEETAQEIAQTFYEDVVAPGYGQEALAILRQKADLRLLEVDLSPNAKRLASIALDFRRVSGGFLVQTPDALTEDELSVRTVTQREATLEELTDLLFAWRAVKHVKSSAVVLAKGLALVGVGAGQMNRADSVMLAVRKAGQRSWGSVLASDAFFSKPDGIDLAAAGGVTAIIQPGGSVRDGDVIRAANRHHLAMVFTGRRHFKH